MSISQILQILCLALLVFVCFSSMKIAGCFVKNNDKKQEEVSLLIKGGALVVAILLFLLFFL